MEGERELAELVERLKQTPLLSRAKANELNRAMMDRSWDGILAGKTFGEATGGLAILNQPEDQFRAELRSIDNDIVRQIGVVNESLDHWFDNGETPPPYYPWRIAVILSKAKRKDEEGAFLKAWCKHFGRCVGTGYEALAARARKLGAF